MRSLGMVSEIELQPLGRSTETTVLAEAAACSDSMRLPTAMHRCCMSTSGGYPLYVVEAARSAGRGTTEPVEVSRSGPDPRPGAKTPQAARKRANSAATRRCCRAGLPARTSRGGERPRRGQLVVRRSMSSGVAGCFARWVDGYDFTHDLLRDAAYVSGRPAAPLARASPAGPGSRAVVRRPVSTRSQLCSPNSTNRGGRAGSAPLIRSISVLPKPWPQSLFANAEALRLLRRCLAHRGPRLCRKDRERDIRELRGPPSDFRARSMPSPPGYVAPESCEKTLAPSAVDLAEQTRPTRRPTRHGPGRGCGPSAFVQGDHHRWLRQRLPGHATPSNSVEKVPELTGQAHFARRRSTLSLGPGPTSPFVHLDLAYDLSLARRVSLSRRHAGPGPTLAPGPTHA